jgi:hypothetical protein
MNNVIASAAKQSHLGLSNPLLAQRNYFAALAMTLAVVIIYTMSHLSKKIIELTNDTRKGIISSVC